MADFWQQAWRVMATLEEGPPNQPDADNVASTLSERLGLQRYVFVYRGFQDPSWLEIFRENGLFEGPPPVENRQGALRASDWPAMAYLRSVANGRADAAATILGGLETDNWWVIDDALDIAAGLPADVAAPLISRLLRLWEANEVQWTRPHTLVDALKTLGGGQASLLTGALRVVVSRFALDRRNPYDLDELLPELQDSLGNAHPSALADACEFALTAMPLVTGERLWGRSLADSARRGDAPSLLIGQWLTSTELEAVEGPSLPAARAVRLLGNESLVLQQMGLRALRLALDGDQPNRVAGQVLEQLAATEGVTADSELGPELIPLFKARIGNLSLEQQADFLERLSSQAESEDEFARRYARHWLHALSFALSAPDQHRLVMLEAEFGPAIEEFTGPTVVTGWMGPNSPISQRELESAGVEELIGLLRHIPVGEPDAPFRSGSPEDFGRTLQPLVASRLGEFAPHLKDIAEALQEAVVAYYFCWGLRDAFNAEGSRSDERLDYIIEFIVELAARTQSGALSPSQDARYQFEVVQRGLVDLIESAAEWLVQSPRAEDLVPVLGWLLDSPDPEPTFEILDRPDPPTTALNSVRGMAVLAGLRIISRFWGDDPLPRDAWFDSTAALLDRNVEIEQSPAVLSSYGRFLGQLVTYWPEFLERHRPRLLDSAPQSPAWDAVFGSYLTFSPPHRSVASALRSEYEQAVNFLPDAGGTFLAERVDRLLQHLIALALPGGSDAQNWSGLLDDGLTNAGPEAAGAAIADLAHAVLRDRADVPTRWVANLVDRRVETSRRSLRPQNLTGGDVSAEASALFELLAVKQAPVTDSAGRLRSVMRLGAAPSVDRVVEYLSEADPGFSQPGVLLLLDSLDQDEVHGYLGEVDALKTLIRGYAATHHDYAWDAVERLGETNAFIFEDVAREIGGPTEG